MSLNQRSFLLGQFETSEQAVQVYNATLISHYHSAVLENTVQESAEAPLVVRSTIYPMVMPMIQALKESKT